MRINQEGRNLKYLPPINEDQSRRKKLEVSSTNQWGSIKKEETWTIFHPSLRINQEGRNLNYLPLINEDNQVGRNLKYLPPINEDQSRRKKLEVSSTNQWGSIKMEETWTIFHPSMRINQEGRNLNYLPLINEDNQVGRNLKYLPPINEDQSRRKKLEVSSTNQWGSIKKEETWTIFHPSLRINQEGRNLKYLPPINEDQSRRKKLEVSSTNQWGSIKMEETWTIFHPSMRINQEGRNLNYLPLINEDNQVGRNLKYLPPINEDQSRRKKLEVSSTNQWGSIKMEETWTIFHPSMRINQEGRNLKYLPLINEDQSRWKKVPGLFLTISKEVVGRDPGPLMFKDLHQHDVKLNSLQTHPGKRWQEQEVEAAGNQSTQKLGRERHGSFSD